MKGKFITLEGPDGSGKTSQMKLLGEYLEARGYQVIYTREPGGTKISEKIREILLNPENLEMVGRTEALLYAAARAQHVEELIIPALKEGKIIISDRFSDSTLAYQGYGRGLDIDFLKEVNKIATGGLEPDITILLDIEPGVGLKRIKEKRCKSGSDEIDRIEQEALAFHKKVRQGFLALAEENPRRIKVVKGDQPLLEVHRLLIKYVKDII